MGVTHTGRFHYREGILHPAQGVDRRAEHQHLGFRVFPQQPVHVVVGLIGYIAQAVLVAVPAQVVTPEIAFALFGPGLGAGGHILDLALVVHEGVVKNFVVFRAGGQVNADVAVGKQVAFEGVIQGVIDKHGLAFAPGNHHVTGLPFRHALHHVAPQGGVGDEVHQDSVVLVVFRAVVDNGQALALHQGIAGAGASGKVAFQQVVHGIHVVDAIPQIRHHIVEDFVVIGGVFLSGIMGLAYGVVFNTRSGSISTVDTVAPVLGPQADIASN